MKLIICLGIFLYIFPFIFNQKKLLFQQCNYNYYSKKNKIANEIDLLNIISKKSYDIFALLTEKERYFFSLILTKCKKYLEFGMGGSTLKILKYIIKKIKKEEILKIKIFLLLAYMTSNIKKIISVESNIKWINKIRKFKNIKNEEGKRIILEYINIGKTIYNGFPYNMAKNKNFFKYSKHILKNMKMIMI